MRKQLSNLWIGVCIVLITLVYAIINFQNHSKVIYPDSKFVQNYDVHTYHEQTRKSICDVQIKNNEINFTYELRNHEGFPFAGCFIRKKDSTQSIINVSNFNQLVIDISSKEGKRLPILLKMKYPPYFDKEDFRELSLEYVLEYEEPGTYRINLNEFKIPSWWIREHGVKKESIDASQYTELMFFVVESCESIATDVKDEITLKEIRFEHNNLQVFINAFVFLFIGFTGLIIQRNSNRKEKIEPSMSEKLVTERSSEPKSEIAPIDKMESYIQEHYDNPELDAKILSKATGVSTREMGKIFKTSTGLSFKSYLNRVRLNEVKQLLKSSDLSISEIAYRCGYNQIPHFNRIFKKDTGLSPKEFREEKDN